MDSVFQMPGLLFKAWLVFTELSATLYNQQLESWFSKLHWRSGSNSNFSKKFPFEKPYGEIRPVNPLETTFSSSEIFVPVWYSNWIVQKWFKHKTFWKQLSWQMSCVISIFFMKINVGGFSIVIRGISSHLPLGVSLLHMPQRWVQAYAGITTVPGSFFVLFSPDLSRKPRYGIQTQPTLCIQPRHLFLAAFPGPLQTSLVSLFSACLWCDSNVGSHSGRKPAAPK